MTAYEMRISDWSSDVCSSDLDSKMVPERRNTIKVLLFLDVGGSMDDHVRACEELCSAARSEFKHLEYFYFHNCLYERVWQDNRRRHAQQLDTWEVLRTYPADYKAIFVGDATMSPYEIVYPGGSVEHWNAEPGVHWMQRLLSTYHRAVWINPQPHDMWRYHERSEEHTSELQSLMRISYAVFCLKKKKEKKISKTTTD